MVSSFGGGYSRAGFYSIVFLWTVLYSNMSGSLQLPRKGGCDCPFCTTSSWFRLQAASCFRIWMATGAWFPLSNCLAGLHLLPLGVRFSPNQFW